MTTPTLTPEQIARISGLVTRYIAEQRERFEKGKDIFQEPVGVWHRFALGIKADLSTGRGNCKGKGQRNGL